MGFAIAGGSPEKLNVEDAVLDRSEIGVTLDSHDVLDVEAVGGFGPNAHQDNAIKNRGDCECQVPELEPLGTDGEQQGARDGRQEDVGRDGRVVEKPCRD
ncbi:hypothetical protein HYQ46_004806 [Verticillium longisporum]|nr:hypothetical protein HYQ46_004806 [Verticillium longisporum]